ncbi:HD domain-containing protein [Candidatus Woesearchaeota archaeon]|nr:HD domain-containing protein [Candidatus Woesearchaeota archaeon]
MPGTDPAVTEQTLGRIFSFLHTIESLKSTLRYSSTTSGRKESSAEHSWRLALTSFVVAEELSLQVDVLRTMKLALIHDLPEAITGDIDAIKFYEGSFSRERKRALEAEAIATLRGLLPPRSAAELSSLWDEYARQESPEARFVNALDKIETTTQLYETGHTIYDKPEFIANYADDAVKAFPELGGMLKVLKRKLKAEFKKGGIPWKPGYDALP